MFWAIFIVLLVGGFLLYALVDAFKADTTWGAFPTRIFFDTYYMCTSLGRRRVCNVNI